MKRLSFLVNNGENGCFMAHGLDWAAYEEAANWEELALKIREIVHREFMDDERPSFLDFRFMDGRIISLSA
jgi:hypothetical protein